MHVDACVVAALTGFEVDFSNTDGWPERVVLLISRDYDLLGGVITINVTPHHRWWSPGCKTSSPRVGEKWCGFPTTGPLYKDDGWQERMAADILGACSEAGW